MPSEYVDIQVTVNGHSYRRLVPARLTAADFLRDELELTGTHLGCEHGVCGACTILIDGTAARGCIVYAPQLDDTTVTTVEGLAEEGGALSRLQQSFCDSHALQCGFCTPGFLMVAADHISRGGPLEEHDVKEAIAGNICRCTSYSEIVTAIMNSAG